MSGEKNERGRHHFVLMLDDDPIEGHLFGTLKVEMTPGTWVPVERRCRLCNRLPIELLTVDWTTAPCAGVRFGETTWPAPAAPELLAGDA